MAVGPASPALASLKEDADWEMAIHHKARQVPLARYLLESPLT